MTTNLGVMTSQINVECDHRPKLSELVGCKRFINRVGPRTWQVYDHQPLLGLTLPSHLHEQSHQVYVDVVIAGADTVFLNESMPCQLLQIPGRRLPCLEVQVFLDVRDPCVGMPEEIVEQILAVEPGKFGSHAVFDRCHLAVDAVNQLQRHCGGLSNGIEHEDDPVLPVAGGPHRLQESVIL